MSINGVSNLQGTTYTQQTKSTSKADNKTADSKKTSENVTEENENGVVYEPSNATESNESGSKVKDYSSIVKQLKSDLNTRNQQLQNLVDNLLNKQANKYTKLSQLFQDIKDGKVSVDSDTVTQAKKDVAEDGYWGIEQTSDRLVSMAQALSNGDPEQADKMITAIKKGFDQATKAWGDNLPDICQKTIDAATKKLENWRDGITASTAAEE